MLLSIPIRLSIQNSVCNEEGFPSPLADNESFQFSGQCPSGFFRGEHQSVCATKRRMSERMGRPPSHNGCGAVSRKVYIIHLRIEVVQILSVGQFGVEEAFFRAHLEVVQPRGIRQDLLEMTDHPLLRFDGFRAAGPHQGIRVRRAVVVIERFVQIDDFDLLHAEGCVEVHVFPDVEFVREAEASARVAGTAHQLVPACGVEVMEEPLHDRFVVQRLRLLFGVVLLAVTVDVDIADHHVGVFRLRLRIEFLQHGGFQPVVRVHMDGVFSRDMVKSHVPCAAESAVGLMVGMHAAVLTGIFVAHLPATVTATIVDQHQLEVGEGLRQDGLHASVQVCFGLVDWADDGDGGHGN